MAAEPSEFAKRQYAALMAAEANRTHLSDLKTNLKKRIEGLRKAFTAKPNEKESLPQDGSTTPASFQGGYKLTQAQESSTAVSTASGGGSNFGISREAWWTSDENLSGTTLLSSPALSGRASEEVATPYDSGLDLVTPAWSPLDAPSFDSNGSYVPIVSRNVRNVSQGTINHDNGDYIRFGSINKPVTIQRAPSVQSHSAISISNSKLDEAESLAETFPEIGEVVAKGGRSN